MRIPDNLEDRAWMIEKRLFLVGSFDIAESGRLGNIKDSVVIG